MAEVRVAAAVTATEPVAVPASAAAGPSSDPIDQLRQRFTKHDRPLAEVRRLVDASMGDRLLSEELRQMRDDA